MTDSNGIGFYTTTISSDFLYTVVREGDEIHILYKVERRGKLSLTCRMIDTKAIRFYTKTISFDFLYQVVKEGDEIHTFLYKVERRGRLSRLLSEQ